MKTLSTIPKKIWALLMTPVGERIPLGRTKSGKKRRAPHGIALFTVLIGLTLMSTVVTDLGYNEMVRYKLAAHDRDAMKAQALAESGVNVSRLLLAVQAAIQPLLTQVVAMGIPLPSHTVWELIPLESDLLKGLADGSLQGMVGLDVSEALAKREEERAELKEDLAYDFDEDWEGAGDGPFVPPPGGFGAFDGSFGVKIEDEASKAVHLRGWTAVSTNTGAERFSYAQALYTLFQPTRFDFLFEERDSRGNRVDRYELLANFYDWMDTNEDATDPRAEPADWGRLGAGSEDGVYSSYDRLVPKNEYPDSPGELRLIHGMSDAHWKAFGDDISIYAENKINILSATPLAVETAIRRCAANPQDPLLFDPLWMKRTVQGWFSCKSIGVIGGGCQASPRGFAGYLQTGLNTNGTALAIDAEACEDAVGTESKNFTVKATGRVGDTERTITLVVRVDGPSEERYFYSIVK